MKRAAVFSVVWVVETFVALFMPRVGTHKLLLTPGIEPLRWTLGRWRAWRTAERAAKRVPAYRAFLAESGRASRLDTRGGIAAAISALPEMDKDSYVKRWSIPERCIDGRLPRRGVVVDESSGSSGTPTSWVRGPDERQATRQLLQLGFSRTAKDLSKQPFVLNAFSLGAWATGMNVTASLTESSMIKSIGPDRDKIVQTMREFGTDFTYIICSYPPFLKALFEDDRLDWSQYTIVAAFGGRGHQREHARPHRAVRAGRPRLLRGERPRDQPRHRDTVQRAAPPGDRRLTGTLRCPDQAGRVRGAADGSSSTRSAT
ncbi:hypothetical protein WDV91_08345 [Curtobacterium flaccumfaciens pv. flaccumfaciens]